MTFPIPPSLTSRVQEFQYAVAEDLLARLTTICHELHASQTHLPIAFDFVCPICESYMFYVYVADSRALTNNPHTLKCQHCQSNSSLQILYCREVALLFFLKHVPSYQSIE